MYVFYPASYLVGLSTDYREISQASPFPSKYQDLEPEEAKRQTKTDSEEAGKKNSPGETYANLKESDCFSRSSRLRDLKTKQNKFCESSLLSHGKGKCKKKLRERKKSFDTNSLEETLNNLKNYIESKPTPLKRHWSLHLKKTVTINLIKMAALECALREMTHPALNDTLKSHNAVTFKLVKTVSEFTESLAHIYEKHSEEMQVLVSNFRKKNSELRKERPACASSLFHTWETLLQEVEIDAQAHSEIASILGRQVSRPLLEKSFFRKIESRKVFSNREVYENLLKQAEDKLGKTKIEYKTSFLSYMNNPSTQTLVNYVTSHNEYVGQLHLTNGLLNRYHSETLPAILQEIEDIYNDLCIKISDSLLQVSEIIFSKAQEQSKRYDGLMSQCRSVQGPTDLAHFVRSITIPPNNPPVKRYFMPPQPPQAQVGSDGPQLPADSSSFNLPPTLKNEIVLDRMTSNQVREKYESARKEYSELETQVKQLSDALLTLTRVQQRSIDSNLYNKVNELQEDISLKQHELNIAVIRMSGVKAQKELFSNKVESAETGRERKMSSSSTGSMKSKWMKALKSLKTPPTNGNTTKEADKKNGTTSFTVDSTAHSFQDYTYKKITPCDVCSQVLRGHTRQGLKCRICKLNVHVDCQDKVPKCQQKSRLLRRQKSTSEIDTKMQEPSLEEETTKQNQSTGKHVHQEKEQSFTGGGGGGGQLQSPNAMGRVVQTTNPDNIEIDQVYQVLKQAVDLGQKPPSLIGRNSLISETYQTRNPATAFGARSEKPPDFERVLSTERKNEYVFTTTKTQKTTSRSRSDYYTNQDFYQTTDFYQHSPKSFKNRLSDPGVIHLNNAACLGPSASGTATSGTAFTESVSQPRRQQGPVLLRGNTTSHSCGPVPVATSSDEMDIALRRRLFSGFKSFSVFGGKSRGESPSSRSISLPETPHSPRRQKLNLRMKSLSLDSPESTEHVQKRRAQASNSAGQSSQSSSSKVHSPSSPVHGRRLLSARSIRMSSMELPDDVDKSFSSASTSPCPSPKPHRLLPTSLYVVLYNFKSRHPDELDLKAGYKVTVMDSSDPDWWKGKCLGRVGYFPSKYVIKLEPGERPLQVTHNLQVHDGDTGIMLLRDQIVIQVGEDVDGLIMIRNADNKQGACPTKFLQEV